MGENPRLEKKYQALTLRAKQLLNSLGVYSYKDSVANYDNVVAFLEKTSIRSKAIAEISFFFEGLERHPAALPIGRFSNKEHLASKNPIQDKIVEYLTPYSKLPIIYFLEILKFNTIKVLYENKMFYLEDLITKENKFDKVIEKIYLFINSQKLNDFKLEELKLPFSVTKVLSFNSIVYYSELEPFLNSYERFQELTFANKDSYSALAVAIDTKSKNIPDISDFTKLNFMEKICYTMQMMKPLDRGVTFERLINNKTLQEIGDIHHITRERVRQIEEKGIFLIQPLIEDFWQKEISRNPSLSRILSKEPLLLPKQIYLLSSLGIKSQELEKLINICPYLKTSDITQIGGNGYIFYQVTDPQIEFNYIFEFIKNKAILNDYKNDNKNAIENLYYQLLAAEIIKRNVAQKSYISNFIQKLIQEDFQIISNRPYINTKKIPLQEIIKVILRDYEALHFSKIYQILKDEYNFDVDIRNVHNTLSRSTNFVNVGRGLYANIGSKYSGQTVASLIKQLLIQEGKPLNIRIIEKYVLSKKKIKLPSVYATIRNKAKIFGCTITGEIGLISWKDIYEFETIKPRLSHSFVDTNSNYRHRLFPISSKEALDILKNARMLPSTFTKYDYINILKQQFEGRTNKNELSIGAFLSRMVKEGQLRKINSKYSI